MFSARVRPDAVLLDIGLPKMNGYDVCRAIRGRAWGRDLATIALTGWGQEEDRRKSKDAGFDAHLVKPVENRAVASRSSLRCSARAPASSGGE